MSATSFVHAARAVDTPRAAGDDTSQKPQMRNAGMIASFELALDTYCVKGNVTHANASVNASRQPPKRRPTRKRPRSARRSHRMLVKCAAGRLWTLPVH